MSSTVTKNKRIHLTLAKFLTRHGVRYKWVGAWPAIPVKLAPLEFDKRVWRDAPPNLVVHNLADGTSIKMLPPDVLPVWVESIYECLFEKILPLKKDITIEFYDAAIFGYAYAAISREAAWRKEARKSLLPESEDAQVHEELLKHCNPTLEACRNRITEVLADWKLQEAADYLNGFAYGIKCQHREEGWTPSATTQTLQIYKALVRNRRYVQNLVRLGKTAKEIGEYIAQRATLYDGKTTHSCLFCRTEEGKTKYLKSFQKLCERVGLPLPSPGRPPINSKIATSKN